MVDALAQQVSRGMDKSRRGGGHCKGAHDEERSMSGDWRARPSLRRAGIGYVEVVGGEMNQGELRRVVEKLIAPSA